MTPERSSAAPSRVSRRSAAVKEASPITSESVTSSVATAVVRGSGDTCSTEDTTGAVTSTNSEKVASETLPAASTVRTRMSRAPGPERVKAPRKLVPVTTASPRSVPAVMSRSRTASPACGRSPSSASESALVSPSADDSPLSGSTRMLVAAPGSDRSSTQADVATPLAALPARSRMPAPVTART